MPTQRSYLANTPQLTPEIVEELLEHFMDPVNGSNAKGRKPIGMCCLHVDDLFITGTPEFLEKFKRIVKSQFKIGHEDINDLMFTGQRVKWIIDEKTKKKSYIVVEQSLCVSELTEVVIPKGKKDDEKCDKDLHTAYRSLLGSINWLQSRAQFQSCYQFSRCASAAAGPTIGDCKALNKLCRQIVSDPMELMFWPLQGDPRLVAMPDAAFRNNSDKSSQRAMVIFMAEPRKERSRNTKGSLIFFESTKIKRTTLSTTVAELYALMKCYGTCQMLRGLIKDITGLSSEIHMRTDANNLVTTASTTHVPEQQETIHMIQMLRKEACSGSIADLSHIRTQWCLADCLTKKSANPQNLIDAVRQGVLKEVDAHPPFRSLLEHKAYLRSWLPTVCTHVDFSHDVSLLGDLLRNCWLFLNLCLRLKKSSRQSQFALPTTVKMTSSGSGRWNQGDATHQWEEHQGYSHQWEKPSYWDDNKADDFSTQFDYSRLHSQGRTHQQREMVPEGSEDHMEKCKDYRNVVVWCNAQSSLRLRHVRNLMNLHHPMMYPEDIKVVLMDVTAWALRWGKEKFDPFLQWQAEFTRFMLGFVEDHEERWFSEKADSFRADMKSHSSMYKGYSKSFTTVLRHNRDSSKSWIFDDRGTVELSVLFAQFPQLNPVKHGITGAQFAAFLYSNEKQRFMVDLHLKSLWCSNTVPPETPFEIRLGCFQGHTNQRVDPTQLHHRLTPIECACLGWIFHVTDESNLRSIQQKGLMKQGRDAVHFMYENDHGPGYIMKGHGTVAPRHYANPRYLVLLPEYFEHGRPLFLSQNGVVLCNDNVPMSFLKVVDQKPSLAANVISRGKGHTLPSAVTGGIFNVYPTYDQLRLEKGESYEPGGNVPPFARKTAWEYMGQQTPEPYRKLIFTTPMLQRIVYEAMVKGSSAQPEVPKGPSQDPSKESSSKGEESSGSKAASSQQRSDKPEESQGPNYDPWAEWEPEPSSDKPEEGKTAKAERSYKEEESAKDQDMEDSDIEEYGTTEDRIQHDLQTSFAGANPWILYEAGIICVKDNKGELQRNASEEKVINLLEWDNLEDNQVLALLRQGIGPEQWQEISWTGHFCYLFTAAWEIGRTRSLCMREEDPDESKRVLQNIRHHGWDWHRGNCEPYGYEKRHDLPRESWTPDIKMYERNEEIQADMEWLSEAVCNLYRNVLDQFIRQNDRLWGDFCKKLIDENTGLTTEYLDLNTTGYDIRGGQTVPMNSNCEANARRTLCILHQTHGSCR